MEFKDLTNEQIEKAKACTTWEEKLAFIQEFNIEVPDDLLDEVSGGARTFAKNTCPAAGNRNNGNHRWHKTGKQRPGAIFGNVWKDDEVQCEYCGKLDWFA